MPNIHPTLSDIISAFCREAPHFVWSARFVRHDDEGFLIDAEDDATFALLFDCGVYVADIHRLDSEVTDAELHARVRKMLTALNAGIFNNRGVRGPH